MTRGEERETGRAGYGDERWEHVGRAAEHFARRMARDAGRFAERLEGNATEFAHEVSREWRRAARRHHRHRHHRRGCTPGEADVRRAFEDVRGILKDVLNGVDDLIEKLFHDGDKADGGPENAQTGDGESAAWHMIVANRELACGSCDRVVGAGEEVEVRNRDGEREVRCMQCRE